MRLVAGCAPWFLVPLYAALLVSALHHYKPLAIARDHGLTEKPAWANSLVSYEPRALANSTNSTVANRGLASAVPVTSGHGSYFVTLSAGGINFQVALDTASSDLWILSSDCKSSACSPLPKYPLSFSSPTFVPIDQNNTVFNISFADATFASGFVARESVDLGNITVPEQALAFINSTNVAFTDRISGVLGLGFPRLSVIGSSTPAAPPFISTMVETGLLAYPMFGLSLTYQNNGSLSLGAIDSSVVSNLSAIEWHPVVPFAPFSNTTVANSSIYLQWALELSDIFVNGTEVKPSPTYANITGPNSIALLDVGADGIFGPYQDVSRIFDALSPESRLVDTGRWAVPCDTSLPIQFTFGGQNFTLGPKDYLIGPTSTSPDLCLSWPAALPSSGDGIDWQLGTPFLRTVYSIFSYGIDTKEPPMIGLYNPSISSSLNSTNSTSILSPQSSMSSTSTLASSTLASSSSSASSSTSPSPISFTTTITTTLPNFPLATPVPTAPSYIFNLTGPTSQAHPTPSQRVSSDLGASTYSPIIINHNFSALPTIVPFETLVTLVVTDSSGVVHTSTSTSSVVQSSVALGQPPGAKSSAVSVLRFSKVDWAAWVVVWVGVGLGWTLVL
ncbi:acid protease [Sistotremastrum suecicum HHB10207 ss-3]|uniref:Acid protease n=1 Tax=Sistotremastrum suecicum HHB10207 ss-3 TaxID=1314776 RepID=A0A166FAJ5_9AGAM|nr:acid protease [Sistotremastrum suecicum HHB10207 ss-3]